MSEPIYLPNGRVAGVLRGLTFVKSASRSLHMLRRPPAWAIDAGILDQLEARGVQRVVVRERETGAKYEARLSLFRTRGVRVSRGFGEQIALPLAYWRVNGAPSEYERQTKRPMQPLLLGMLEAGNAG